MIAKDTDLLKNKFKISITISSVIDIALDWLSDASSIIAERLRDMRIRLHKVQILGGAI